ncbi:short-chain dehydrogenase [Sphingobacteriaceae bacterium]|nr:short-chain dehydrogenase [Sphingobacteriaceae bacterium]
MDLKNKTILITGGTSGFGLLFAEKLFKGGNTVIITGRDADKLALVKNQFPSIHTFQSDVSKVDDILHLFTHVTKQFPALSILINNAGEMRRINLHDPANDIHNITREIEINLSGPIRMIQHFLPFLKTKPEAAILNVTSGLALVPFPISPVYGATKSGLRSYTRSLRVQLKKTNIKVFELIAPAANTPLAAKFSKDVDSRTAMDPNKLVDLAIKGLHNDTYEIYPGMAKAMKLLSRLIPDQFLKLLSKPVDAMLAEQ